MSNRLISSLFLVVTLWSIPAVSARGHRGAEVPRVTAFTEAPAPTAGWVGPGIAAFVPAGVAPAKALSLPSFIQPLVVDPARQLPAEFAPRPTFDTGGGRWNVRLTAPAGTDFYGTGEVTGTLRRNGRTVTLWNTDNVEYRRDAPADEPREHSPSCRLYQAHPFVLGLRRDGTAFGVIFCSTWRSELAIGRTTVRFVSDGPPCGVVVIDLPTVDGVLRCLADLVGTIELPPLWALGYQQCRWSYAPAARVREVAAGFRRRRIPCDVMWMDIDYMDGFRVFTFDPKGFPEPAALNDWLHRRGFHSVWMLDPGIKVDDGWDVYRHGSAEGVWVAGPDGRPFVGKCWPGDCVWPDFTRPEARAWWERWFPDFLAQGVDGLWNDMNEPAVFEGPDNTMPVDNRHGGGDDLVPGVHLQYHNVYGMLMSRASYEAMRRVRPGRRPFVLTRSSFLGGHRYAATWTGDNCATWTHLRWSIPMSLNLGLSGQPFSGPDIGGFNFDGNAELYAHWMALGAFYPFSRGHTCKDTRQKEPWAFGSDVEAVARRALERRYRLLPYLYTLFREAATTGLPVMRPLFMAAPRDLALRREDRAFMLGPSLLVVPRWARGCRVPPGMWRTIHLVDEASARDPYQVDLRLRGGAILPLGRVVQSTTEELLAPLTLVVCLDEQGRAVGRLYEDEGDGYGYRDGDYLLTTYRAERRDDGVHVEVSATEGRRPRPSRPLVVELVGRRGVTRAEGRDGRTVVVPTSGRD